MQAAVTATDRAQDAYDVINIGVNVTQAVNNMEECDPLWETALNIGGSMDRGGLHLLPTGGMVVALMAVMRRREILS